MARDESRRGDRRLCGTRASKLELLPHALHASDHVAELLSRGPARRLAQAAVGRERELLRGHVLEAELDARGDVIRRLDVIALHVHAADGDVEALRDLARDLDLGELAARHLHVELIRLELEKGGKHGRVTPVADSATLVVSKTEMRRQPSATDHRLDRAIEDIDEAARILAVRVAAHRWLVDRDLARARLDQPIELGTDDRKERLRERPAIRVAIVRNQAPAQGVRPGKRCLENRSGRRDAAQALELLDGAEPARSAKLARHAMLAALIVRGRAEAPRRRALELDPFEEAVEGKVEVEPRLLAVGDDIES